MSIQAGVRGCPVCGDATHVGAVFIVHDAYINDTPSVCCGDTNPILVANSVDYELAIELVSLKRIPPLSELDSITREVTA